MAVTRLDVAEASAHMLAGAEPLRAEDVSLRDALGRVLARDVTSPVSLPPWDNASMDGYAVHADDVRGSTPDAPVRLRVVETIAAGGSATRVLARGEAARIMTGAPVPAGADSVVRVEDTDGGSEMVAIRDDRDAERNVRSRGEDVRADSVVMRAGTPLGPAHVGVLASIGCVAPAVYARPRVAILATGDELVPVERFDAVRDGTRIVSSNSYALEAAVLAAGGEPVPLGIARDDPREIGERLRAANGCDLLLTSGGVSVGDFDYVRSVVESLGGTLSLWRVRMRPGAPIAFGRVFGAPWLGLPGNPVSALVTFELFARPLVRTLAGYRKPHRRTVPVIIDEPLELGAPLTHFLRATLARRDDGRLHARLTGAQSSGMLTSMANADALVVVPPNHMQVAPGAVLAAIPLDGDLGGDERLPVQ